MDHHGIFGWFQTNPNDDRAIETGCCEFRALGALLSQPAESVVWYTLGLPNAAGVTWLYQLLGVSPMSPIRRVSIWTQSHGPRQEVFFVDGLKAELDFLSGTSDGGNIWKCRADRYRMIRYQYGTMCAEFRGSSAISHLHHLASAGCTDIFVHSHHCVGGVSFPRVASGHHFQHICRVKNMTWGELCAPFKLLIVVALFVLVNIRKADESCSPGHFRYDGSRLGRAPGFIPTPGDVLEFELEKGKLESPVEVSCPTTSELDIRKSMTVKRRLDAIGASLCAEEERWNNQFHCD